MPGFKYLPIPDEKSKIKLERMGFRFFGGYGLTTEYELPFGWHITRLICEPAFIITDFWGKLRVEIDGNKYIIIEKEDDEEMEL